MNRPLKGCLRMIYVSVLIFIIYILFFVKGAKEKTFLINGKNCIYYEYPSFPRDRKRNKKVRIIKNIQNGVLNKKRVKKSFNRYCNDLIRFYNRNLRKYPRLDGEVTVHVFLSKDHKVEVVKTNIHKKEFLRALEVFIKDWNIKNDHLSFNSSLIDKKMIYKNEKAVLELVLKFKRRREVINISSEPSS